MKTIKNYFTFFPFQLFLLHFKKNQVLILLWIILFGIVTQNVARSFGIPYLFISPEYLGEVSLLSYFILGFSIGGFIMAFHLYSYVLLGPSFPFIATLSKPFSKFCLNNSIIPVLFITTLIANIYNVEYFEDLKSKNEILMNCISLIVGVLVFILISLAYFRLTNKNSNKFNIEKDNLAKSILLRPFNLMQINIAKEYQPKYYLKNILQIKATRPTEHYEKKLFEKVLKQNYFNATLFEIVVIGTFIFLGFFQGESIFLIPASASIMLLFTLLIMIVSILYSWFKKWTLTISIILLIGVNYLSNHSSFFSIKSFAYGLDYSSNTPYSIKHLKDIQFNDDQVEKDIEHHIEILNNWKEKAVLKQKVNKPKLIIVNVSGGGIRAALWTFNVLQKLNLAFDGKFMSSTHLLTGASGGMLGGAYYRELYYQSIKNGIDLQDPKYMEQMGQDLLNRLSFTMVTNDLFFKNGKFIYDNKIYAKDRGYSFEQNFNENTQGLLNKSISAYREVEFLSDIPLIVLSPTIINDGRRLLISPQPFGFINGTTFNKKDVGPENVELLKLFSENSANDLSFLTALRMNATFPYVLPMINLPTQPEIAVMDAGIRDNYGIKTSLRYIQTFEEWLIKNTSGVILVEIRDIQKDYDFANKKVFSILDRLIKPIGNFYGNYLHTQEYNASELFELIDNSNLNIDKISFLLRKNPQEKISLSWHLTEIEKLKINNAFENAVNQNELLKLIRLLR